MYYLPCFLNFFPLLLKCFSRQPQKGGRRNSEPVVNTNLISASSHPLLDKEARAAAAAPPRGCEPPTGERVGCIRELNGNNRGKHNLIPRTSKSSRW